MSPTQNAVALARVRRWAASGAARRIREENQLSLPEVARVVGVSHPTILRWERGERLPRGAPALLYDALLTALVNARERRLRPTD